MISPSSSQQRRLLQSALQVAVHLDVAVAQIHAQLVEAFDQPGPVCAAQRLHAQRRDGGSPVMAFISAARGADLRGGNPEERGRCFKYKRDGRESRRINPGKSFSFHFNYRNEKQSTVEISFLYFK